MLRIADAVFPVVLMNSNVNPCHAEYAVVGVVKVLCILRHGGVQLISAYSWARPAILVAGKGRG